MSKSPTLLIIPGWQDSGPTHWQTLWEKKFSATKVMQKEWMYPQRKDWAHTLDETILKAKAPIILIAHSLGCHAVADWAAHGDTSKVQAALLVAPPDLDQADTPVEIQTFKPMRLERLPFKSILVGSTTDPYATAERLKIFAQAWGSDFKNLGDQGHINVTAGFGNWPAGEEVLATLLNT